MIIALTSTGWGKQTETLMATYKAVIRPALGYASSIWSPLASSTSINKLQVMQNAALRTSTECTQDINIQHLHDETVILPIHERTYSSTRRNTNRKHNIHHPPPASQYSKEKNTIFYNDRYTTNIPIDSHTITSRDIKQACPIYIYLLSLDI